MTYTNFHKLKYAEAMMAISIYNVIHILTLRRWRNITQSTAKFKGGGGDFILEKDDGRWGCLPRKLVEVWQLGS